MKVSLPDFTRARVLVVGDIMLDRYWYGNTGRISPEAPVPVVKVDSLEERPGGAANVAMNIAALNGGNCLVGFVGEDDAANILSNALTQNNVNYDLIALSTHPTITKLRIISRHQQLLRLDFEESFQGVDEQLLTDRVNQVLTKYNVLVLSDYAKGCLDSVQKIIALAKAKNIAVLIDPKGTDFSRYKGATLLTPNLAEFEAVVGKCRDDEEIVQKGAQLIHDMDLNALLITRSEHGMTLLQRDKKPLHLPTQAKEVFDVTGAGDTVIAILAAAYSTGESLENSCFLANVAAGIVVGKVGTSTVSHKEFIEALNKRECHGFGIVNEETLKAEVEAARERGEKIVMTNGCFDLLHAGHVSYLNEAKKLGDRLIVAVNSDESVKRLKGEKRPINHLEQRMIVLSALSAVDWVVPFNEDTPQRLISEILPDILVKGGDYKPEDISGGQEVIAAGGEVCVLNFEEGISTTKIINQINQQGM